MVAQGSGGAYTDKDYILDQLPYAQGLQFEVIFYQMHHVPVLIPSSQRKPTRRIV